MKGNERWKEYDNVNCNVENEYFEYIKIKMKIKKNKFEIIHKKKENFLICIERFNS